MALSLCQSYNCTMYGKRSLFCNPNLLRWVVNLYLSQHGHLPSTKLGAKHGQYTLLDNESVMHSVWHYLAAQNLGAITPHTLCCHVNDVILPTLDLSAKGCTICKRMAISWLKKLGYSCKDVKKGVYFDGHEQPDVVKAQKMFLDKISQYEW